MARSRTDGDEVALGKDLLAGLPTTYDAPQYPPPPPPTAPATTINGAPQAPYLAPPPKGPLPSFSPANHVPYASGQPCGVASPANIGRPWSTGIFDCGLNQTNAIMTAFFPCVTFGQIAEILDEGGTSCTLGSFMYVLMVPALLTCWVIGSNYRKKLRHKYDLVEAPSEDWTLHLFCPCCALCQEFRELQHRGIDPSLGWMGYMAQR